MNTIALSVSKLMMRKKLRTSCAGMMTLECLAGITWFVRQANQSLDDNTRFAMLLFLNSMMR